MAKILIVDDSKFMRLTLKNVLEKQFNGLHTVVGEASTAQEAVEKFLQSASPDNDGHNNARRIRP